MTKKRGLGRGLDVLLGDLHKKTAQPASIQQVDSNASQVTEVRLEGDLKNLSLDHITAGRYQPRQTFDETGLQELADSIRAQGVIQPIVVRTTLNNQYEIIAGERRFRAAKLAGLNAIPALVRELPDEAVMAMALIENMQREDLNPLEEAIGLQRLIEEFSMTHLQVANAVGKSRTTVTNLLRLLTLEAEVREMLANGLLEMGHARALLALTGRQQISAATKLIDEKLSVRETEQFVKRLQNLTGSDASVSSEKIADPYIESKKHLAKHLLAKVLIQQHASGRGKLIIKYKDAEHLQEILQKII